MTSSNACCSAKNIILVIVVYSSVISYIVYDFYFKVDDLSYYGTEMVVTEVSHKDGIIELENQHVTLSNNDAMLPSDILETTTAKSTPSQNSSTAIAYDNKIEVYGSPRQEEKYVVFGCSTPKDGDFTYAFYLPLDVIAWQRVNYSCIIVIAGSRAHWSNHTVLSIIIKELEKMRTILIFINSAPEIQTQLSQLSRLFVAVLLPWNDLDSYLITADADIWPISGTLFHLSLGKKIVSSNSECCGFFNFKGQSYKMLPMCYLGMSISTWSEVMGFKKGQTIKYSNFITDFVAADFGDIVRKPVSKGLNNGWFLDQHLISVNIGTWSLQHSPELIEYIRRDTGQDRIDRSNWNPYRTDMKKDAHLLTEPYKPGTWERLLPLIHQLFNKSQISYAEIYRELFLKEYFKLKDKQ